MAEISVGEALLGDEEKFDRERTALHDKMQLVLVGENCSVVVACCADSMASAFAKLAEDVQDAHNMVDCIAGDIKKAIRDHWDEMRANMGRVSAAPTTKM